MALTYINDGVYVDLNELVWVEVLVYKTTDETVRYYTAKFTSKSGSDLVVKFDPEEKEVVERLEKILRGEEA